MTHESAETGTEPTPPRILSLKVAARV